MKSIIMYICDTIYEFLHKSKGNVYLAGKYYFGRLMFIRMIPEHVSTPEGYEVLTQSMPKIQAEKRITNFPLLRVVALKK